jgi:hypothetical protein
MQARAPRSDRPARRNSSVPPRSRHADRLDDALADAEKMARRVEQIVEADPFAATLLAAEYLSRVEELSVNPLEQHGKTDAWTSAFVRLRLMADKRARMPRTEQEEIRLYLVARAEERRLHGLLGRDTINTLAKARGAVRAARRASFLSWLFAALLFVAAAAAAVSLRLGVDWRITAPAAALLVAGGIALAFRGARSKKKIVQARADVSAKERALTERSAFETNPSGRDLLQKLQDEHPLLVKKGLTRSSAPPGRDSGPVTVRPPRSG